MEENTGRITRLWLAMIPVSDMERALKFYNETLGLRIALDARAFNHAEVGPDEPLAKIGLHATGKQPTDRRRSGVCSIRTTSMHFIGGSRDEGWCSPLNPP